MDARRVAVHGGVLALGWVMACGSPPARDDASTTLGGGLSIGSTGSDDPSETEGAETSSPPPTVTTTSGEDETGDSTDSGPPLPPAQACNYPSTTFGGAMQELDVPTGSPDVLSFSVLGVPEPSLLASATLHFASHDADHPGEEGLVWVNGMGPYELPADAGWDNVDAMSSIDISGATVEGLNVIEFGAGSLEPRSFYRIGDVRVEAQAWVEDCDKAPEPPPPDAVARQVDYRDAAYTMRHNWVLRCDGFEYAFTAYGDEHIGSDCDDLYAPDGSRRGTATFSFPGLVPATYEVQIRSRHTENRNPSGALFVVEGEGIRIDQRDDADFTTDIWGVRELGGDVEVILDSAQESESDSVIFVRLEPVGG